MQFAAASLRSPLSSFLRIGNDILCQRITGAGEGAIISYSANKKTPPQIKKQRISPLLLSGLYPPPGTLPNLTLLERGLGSSASGECSSAVAHHSIRDPTEGAYARSVSSERRRDRLIGGGRCAGYAHHGERIATIGARRQLRIDQASASRSRRSAARASENAQTAAKAHRRVGGVI